MDTSRWTTELGWNDSPDFASSIQVIPEAGVADSGALQVVPANSGPFGIIASPPGQMFYLRAFLRVNPSAAGIFIAVGEAGHGDEIRLRLRDGKVALNSAQGGDGLAPDTANCFECVATPSDWFCVEMMFDGPSESAALWVDGVPAASVVGNVGWHTGGSFPLADKVWFGSYDPGGSSPSVVFDEIAMGTSRIGCESR